MTSEINSPMKGTHSKKDKMYTDKAKNTETPTRVPNPRATPIVKFTQNSFEGC